MFLLLLAIEMIALVAVGIPCLLKLISFWRNGMKVQQIKLWTSGQWISLGGFFLMVGVPKFGGFQYDVSDNAHRLYLVFTIVGLCLLIVGFRLLLASYKKAEETPGWIKWFFNVFV